jgi:hypothetical protein
MQLNEKQKSFLLILTSMALMCILMEIGIYLITRQPYLKTFGIAAGAFIGCTIGIVAARNKP